MMTDPIADMLTRIRNAQAVGKPTVVVPASNLKRVIVDLLTREGWLGGVEVRPSGTGGPREELVLSLRYRRPGIPYLSSIRRISKPGRRVYVAHDSIPRVKGGMGMLVLSTPQGMMSNRDAKRQGIGGEVICEVF